MKYCSKCDRTKPLNKFPKDKNRPDGRGGFCKACRRAYYRANRERLIETAKQWQKENPERAAENHSKHLKRYPRKARARDAVKYAVKAGELPPINTRKCAVCGEQAEHYHHYKGYGRENRLEVQPLCTRCHGKTMRQYEAHQPALPLE